MSEASEASQAPASATGDPLAGLLIDGRYRVLACMARGGMASVYIAEDERLGRRVALKVMHPHLAESERFTARFRQEARSAAKISNPGIVPVYDQGAFHGQGYLVMELVDGPDLRAHVASRDSLTAGDALRFAEEILRALAAAHQAGVIHRDLKPENVLVASDGTLKITDFGLARAASEVSLSSTGSIMGTVAYLAPEVALRGDADGRTDVYAVGIMLFEMLTGTVPGGSATNPVQLAMSRVNEDVPPPSSVEPWIPSEVDDLVAALCARNPDDRPLTANDAAALVGRVRENLPEEVLDHALPVAGQRSPQGPGDTTVTLRSHGQTTTLPVQNRIVHTSGSTVAPQDKQLSGRRRGPLVVISILLLVAAAALGFWWWWQQYGPGSYVDLPDLSGRTVAEAEETLTDLGLASTLTYEHSDDIDAGIVLRTDPPAGEPVHKNNEVGLIVSSGVLMLVVPDVHEMTLEEAQAELQTAGFEVGGTTENWSETVPEGQVISTNPTAGSSVEHWVKVDLSVSKGREPIEIPDVLGLSVDEATEALAGLGLEVDQVDGYSDDYDIGTVAAVAPPAGETVFKGDAVTITKSLGSEYVTVPSVRGLQRTEAISKLEAAGLEVEVVTLADFFDTVGSQSEAAGSSVRRGTVVTITVV